MGFRQQLRRALASRADEAPTPRRKVHAGQLFDAATGEQIDVVTDVDGAAVVLARVTATREGRFTVG